MIEKKYYEQIYAVQISVGLALSIDGVFFVFFRFLIIPTTIRLFVHPTNILNYSIIRLFVSTLIFCFPQPCVLPIYPLGGGLLALCVDISNCPVFVVHWL